MKILFFGLFIIFTSVGAKAACGIVSKVEQIKQERTKIIFENGSQTIINGSTFGSMTEKAVTKIRHQHTQSVNMAITSMTSNLIFCNDGEKQSLSTLSKD